MLTPAESRKRTLAEAGRSAASGAVSGATVSAVLQPLDVLRTRLQTDATAGKHRSISNTVNGIWREGGGVANLWRGSSATVLRVGMGGAIHFFSLQLMREASGTSGTRSGGGGRAGPSGSGNTSSAWLRDAGMGGASRSIAVLLMCPVTTIKTRMEASGETGARYAYRSVPHALSSIARTEGVLSLWRGLLPNLAANAPFSAIHYMCYKQIQVAASPHLPSPTATSFVSGAAASVVATLATQPLDVLRTRAMLRLATPAAGASRFSLLAGIGPRLAKRAMQTTLVWTAYEEIFARWKRVADAARSPA
jgi:solute carrier family 25 protein 38